VGRVLVAVDPAVGVSAGELVAAWEADERARALGGGSASVEVSPSGQFVPGLVELVLIPLAVNVACCTTWCAGWCRGASGNPLKQIMAAVEAAREG
jgi:hypothetical protein